MESQNKTKTMTETSHRVLACVSNRFRNEPSTPGEKSPKARTTSFRKNKKNNAMQSVVPIKKKSLTPPSPIIPGQTKFSHASENHIRESPKSQVLLQSDLDCESVHDLSSIFRSRTNDSRLENGSNDDEDDDKWTLKLANPINESNDDEDCCKSGTFPENMTSEIFLCQGRLSEDEVMGFRLDGLVLV